MERKSSWLHILMFLFLIGMGMLPAATHGSELLEVEVIGVDEGAVYDNILAHLTIIRQKNRKNLTSSIIKRFHAKAEAQIIQAVKPFGYYRPKVTALLIDDREAKSWQAQYDVVLGPPLYLDEVSVHISGQAHDDPVFMDLINKFPIKKGDILNQVEYEKAKQKFTTLSDDRGYFDAKIIHSRIAIDEQAYHATIHLIMDSGPRYCLVPVIFNQTDFKEKFLQNFVPFQPGDFYAIETLLTLRNALDNSDYFSQVNIVQNRFKEKSCVQLEVTLAPKRKDKYTLRTGFGTDSRVRLGLDWQRRYLNRFGHRLGGEFTWAQRKNKVAAKFAYIIPSGQINDEFWEMSLNHKAEDIAYDDLGDLSDFSDESGGITRDNTFSLRVSHHHSTSILGNWLHQLGVTETIALEYMVEDYNLLKLLVPAQFIDDYRDILPESYLTVLEPDYHALIPSISWNYIKTDNRSYARHGRQIGLTLKGASKSIASNFNFFQIHVMSKLIGSLGDNGRLIARFDGAYTDCKIIDMPDLLGRNEAVLPKGLQFSTGGDRSVRGYDYKTLDGEDTLTEGRHLLNVSMEYEHRIFDTWSVAAFTDAGNVFNDYSQVKLEYSAGLGIRWRSPIGLLGLIRLDVAWALSEDDNPARFHLVVGPDF